MKNKKQFTYEDLDKAIDLALKKSGGERNRVEGMRDVTKTILKIFDSSFELKSYEERFIFVEHAIRGLNQGYEQMLYEIDHINVWEDFKKSCQH